MEQVFDGAIPALGALHVAFAPGEGFHYSSVGYALLELVVEEVSGEPFTDYMQRAILTPLGMTHSSFGWTPALRDQAAVGHDWFNRPFPENGYATHAPGGLLTTAADLATFMAATLPGPNGEVVGRGVLTPESVAQTLTPQSLVNSAEPLPVGLGYDALILADGAPVGAHKGGDNRGFKAMIALTMPSGAGIAVLANGDRALIGFIYDVVCAWSGQVVGDPMQAGCRRMMMVRNGQLAVATLLAVGGLVYVAFVIRGLRNGRRRFGWPFSWWKVLRLALLLFLLAAWWLLWYSDLLFTRILAIYPVTTIPGVTPWPTIRLLVPWPTAFVWVSWGVTLWLVAWIAVVFVPRLKAY